MQQADIYRFASEYLALFLDPQTPAAAISESLEVRCESLGFRMDYGNAFRAAFLQGDPLVRTADFEAVAPEITDIALLGSAIASHWHLAQQWDGSGALSKQHRAWFTAALSRLAELTRPADNARIIVFPEAGSLHEEIRVLREELAETLEEYDELVCHTIPNLDAKYRVMFGTLEYEIYRMDCEIRRLRRKIELIRASLNRGETADLQKIASILELEFAEYEEHMREQMELYTCALERENGLFLTQEDAKRLKHLYRTAMKALHPDLHPAQTVSQARLFHQAAAAYENGDLSTLESICVLLEQSAETPSEKPAADSLAQLRTERDRLRSCIETARERIRELQECYPLTEEALLLDDNAAEAYKSELRAALDQLRAMESHYRAEADELAKASAHPRSTRSGLIRNLFDV